MKFQSDFIMKRRMHGMKKWIEHRSAFRFNKLFQFILMILFYFCCIAHAHAKPVNFIIDPLHTYVSWQINHFDFSTQSGKWPAQGTLILDKDNPKNSKVNAVIYVADIHTGDKELNEHLKGELFFSVNQFPTATYVSNHVDITGKDTADVIGTLTLHGVSKPVILHVKLNKVGMNPITNKFSAGFSAHTEIKRSDFGIKTLLPGLSDKVKIDIQLESYTALTLQNTN